jgi:hypothetical protein
MAQEIIPMENINSQAKENRQAEYQNTTDAMFMKAQRNEIPMQEWIDAVEQIRVKYPYVTEDLVIED